MSRILIAFLFLAASAMAVPAEERFFTYGGPSLFGGASPSPFWNWGYTPKIPLPAPAPAPAPATATSAPGATTAASAATSAPAAAAATPQLQFVPLGSLLFGK